MKKRELQLSLYHLHIIVTDVEKIINALGEFQVLPPDLFVPILKYIMIRTRAFYDEFDHHFMKNALSNEIRFKKLEKISHYIQSERDKYFPDIKSMRDIALAHNYRIKTATGYVSIFENPIKFTIPKSAAEHSINAHLMDQLLSAVKFLYPEIHLEMENNITIPKENFPPEIISDRNFHHIISETNRKVQEIADE